MINIEANRGLARAQLFREKRDLPPCTAVLYIGSARSRGEALPKFGRLPRRTSWIRTSGIIGDFGLVPICRQIVLDYQHDAIRPCVRYLQLRFDPVWRFERQPLGYSGDSFDEFATSLSLASVD